MERDPYDFFKGNLDIVLEDMLRAGNQPRGVKSYYSGRWQSLCQVLKRMWLIYIVLLKYTLEYDHFEIHDLLRLHAFTVPALLGVGNFYIPLITSIQVTTQPQIHILYAGIVKFVVKLFHFLKLPPTKTTKEVDVPLMIDGKHYMNAYTKEMREVESDSEIDVAFSSHEFRAAIRNFSSVVAKDKSEVAWEVLPEFHDACSRASPNDRDPIQLAKKDIIKHAHGMFCGMMERLEHSIEYLEACSLFDPLKSQRQANKPKLRVYLDVIIRENPRHAHTHLMASAISFFDAEFDHEYERKGDVMKFYKGVIDSMPGCAQYAMMVCDILCDLRTSVLCESDFSIQGSLLTSDAPRTLLQTAADKMQTKCSNVEFKARGVKAQAKQKKAGTEIFDIKNIDLDSEDFDFQLEVKRANNGNNNQLMDLAQD